MKATLLEIANRDGWRCWLCDEAVDQSRSVNHPEGPSLDHVVSKSRGGATTAANLKLAHRRCNSRKGAATPDPAWPNRFNLIDAPGLYATLARIKRRGEPEIVAIAATIADGQLAAAWAVGRAKAWFAMELTPDVATTGTSELSVIRLTPAGHGLAKPTRRARSKR